MTKSALVLALALTLTACSKTEEKKDSSKKPGFAGSMGVSDDEKVIGEVDSSDSCGDTPPLGLTLLTAPWVREVETDVMNRYQRLDFRVTTMSGSGETREGTLENQVTCSVNGATTFAKVTARVQISPDTVRILENKVDRRYLTFDGEEYTCEANLNPELSFGYALRSSCLILNSGDSLSVFKNGQ